MTNWKLRTTTAHEIEIGGHTLPIPFTPADYAPREPTLYIKDGKATLVFCTQDDDCENPLENRDGEGRIWHHPCSRYGKSDDYYSTLGLDRYGDPILDEDKLQKLWHDKVMSLPLELFEAVEAGLHDDSSPENMRDLLAYESVGDYSTYLQCTSAWGLTAAEAGAVESEIDAIDKALGWNYSLAAEHCAEPANKYAVLLDVYYHSGRSYSVSGGGMQCRWDTSSGEAVWVADQCAQDEIDRRAQVYAWGEVIDCNILRGNGPKWNAVVDGLGSVGMYHEWHEAYAAIEQHIAKYVNTYNITPEQVELGHNRALYEVAEGCVELYDNWQKGNCWCVTTVEYARTEDGEWEEVNHNTVGGYIGDEPECLEWPVPEGYEVAV